MDPVFEEEIRRKPDSLRVWTSYLASKRSAPADFKLILHRRSVTEGLPGSFKLWNMYLKLLVRQFQHMEQVPSIVQAFEEAVLHLPKCPTLWEDYLGFLTDWAGEITHTRRVISSSLRALPVSQHSRVWKIGLRFAKIAPLETGKLIFNKYLKINRSHREIYIAFLLSRQAYADAASELRRLISESKDDFESLEGKSGPELLLEIVRCIRASDESCENVVRWALSRYPQDQAALWISLAESFVERGKFVEAREVCEEALANVLTLRDFSLVFDNYQQFLAGWAETSHSESSLVLASLEELLARRASLLSNVKLRANPHSVAEWLVRASLFPEKDEIFEEALTAIGEKPSEGKVAQVYTTWAKWRWERDDKSGARDILERARKRLRAIQSEAEELWVAWIKLEDSLEVARRAVSKVGLTSSREVWMAVLSVEGRHGGEESVRATQDALLRFGVATIEDVLQFARLEKDAERQYSLYERGLKSFGWDGKRQIWGAYLEKVGRARIDRVRELYEQCLAEEGIPADFAREIYEKFAAHEAREGLVSNALRIVERGVSQMQLASDKLILLEWFVKRCGEVLGRASCRDAYLWGKERLLEGLEAGDEETLLKWLLEFSAAEEELGEIGRARSLLLYASQFGAEIAHFWETWKSFELRRGDEESYKEMKRRRRAIEDLKGGRRLVKGAELFVEGREWSTEMD